MSVVVFNHKQVIIDSFKHCSLIVAADGSEDLLIQPTSLVQADIG